MYVYLLLTQVYNSITEINVIIRLGESSFLKLLQKQCWNNFGFIFSQRTIPQLNKILKSATSLINTVRKHT